ncbi:hypothetical protein JAAARDRAFT_59183 [Jaapia argillacea MUCL 33604]|uniref:DDE Tnp4 domain-containing protein n=1 Tax=Jaapia argillacea MUCL 33604 TaxID=933084 RepID=A0A067PNB6_9AGAM|nr:hypothetical protein JAAARDRAFT_59183 [Jaapia argillacea MUCL 33604]
MGDSAQDLLDVSFLQDEDDEDEALLVVAAALFIGVEEAQEARARRRHGHRLYLTRPELMPLPHVDSPWQRLVHSRNDRAFITTMGFDVNTFFLIHNSGSARRWNDTPIPHSDVVLTGQPHVGGRSLDSVVILLETLKEMREARIMWPRGLEFEENSTVIRTRHPLLMHAFGGADGLGLPVSASSDAEIENATYNGWKSEHFINNVFAFSPDGTIMHATINAPGSWHDAHTAQPLFEKLRVKTPEGYYLVADTAFPRGTRSIKGKIRALLKSGEHITDDAHGQYQILWFNWQLLLYRQTAEWGMRTLQGSFGCLRMPLDTNNPDGQCLLLELCCHLNNVCARCVGINEIWNVYMPVWRQSEDDELWDNLGDLLFREIQHRDCVSRFHLVVT